MKKPTAQVKMKAMVAARLLLGHFDNWVAFEQERQTASQISNRQTARSVSAQIGRSYRQLSDETQKFILENFARCNYFDLANLCNAIQIGHGIYLRLDEFESTFVPLAERIKSRVPFHAHVSISLYGLQFEFPEHHFLRDLEAALNELAEKRQAIRDFPQRRRSSLKERDDARDLVSREKFLSRSVISAAFSLVEAFLSGIFYTSIQNGSFGLLKCDDDFLHYARKKESAPLKGRLDRVVQFASEGLKSVNDDPFTSLIEFGKRYRDSIHHTTPFERKDVEEGGRLLALYEIDSDIALKIAQLSFETVLGILGWAYDDTDATAIGVDCRSLSEKTLGLLGGTGGSE